MKTKIKDSGNSPHVYERTFVLDHTGIQFNDEFLGIAAMILLKQFRFTMKDLPPSQVRLDKDAIEGILKIKFK